MLYTKTDALANIRNRDGKRVFYLGKQDQLTCDARDELTRQRIAILPAEQAKVEEYQLPGGGVIRGKPEHMTHLNARVLVKKTHPRIQFRGMVDLLEAELLLCVRECPGWETPLGEVLELARRLIRADVLEEPVGDTVLGGLDEEQLRSRSHRPQEYYGKPHFMPRPEDDRALLLVNRVRALTRQTELAAADAFADRDGAVTREDILRALNRMSSYLYLIMVQMKGIENGKLKMEN